MSGAEHNFFNRGHADCLDSKENLIFVEPLHKQHLIGRAIDHVFHQYQEHCSLDFHRSICQAAGTETYWQVG